MRPEKGEERFFQRRCRMGSFHYPKNSKPGTSRRSLLMHRSHATGWHFQPGAKVEGVTGNRVEKIIISIIVPYYEQIKFPDNVLRMDPCWLKLKPGLHGCESGSDHEQNPGTGDGSGGTYIFDPG